MGPINPILGAAAGGKIGFVLGTTCEVFIGKAGARIGMQGIVPHTPIKLGTNLNSNQVAKKAYNYGNMF